MSEPVPMQAGRVGWERIEGIGDAIHCDHCLRDTVPFWLGPEPPRLPRRYGARALRTRLCDDCFKAVDAG